MHCYLIMLSGKERRTAIQAYTAQDAVTVAEVNLCSTGQLVADHDQGGLRQSAQLLGGLRQIVLQVREVRCMPDNFVDTLPDWKRRALKVRGYVDLEQEEEGDLI